MEYVHLVYIHTFPIYIHQIPVKTISEFELWGTGMYLHRINISSANAGD